MGREEFLCLFMIHSQTLVLTFPPREEERSLDCRLGEGLEPALAHREIPILVTGGIEGRTNENRPAPCTAHQMPPTLRNQTDRNEQTNTQKAQGSSSPLDEGETFPVLPIDDPSPLGSTW